MKLEVMLAAAAMQPAAAVAPQPKPAWSVDWGDARCTLQRHAPGATGGSFALWRTPGTSDVTIAVLSQPGQRVLEGQSARVMLDGVPSQGTMMTHNVIFAPGTSRGVAIGPLDESFIDAFGRAASIQVDRAGATILTASFTGAAKAVSALRKCEDEVLRTWGIDPVARAGLTRKPRPLSALPGLIRWQDYPESAAHAGAGGSVVARMMVGPTGRVVDCAVVMTSKNAALDSTTCRLLTTRARFEPALDADGKAVAAPSITQVRWTVLTR